MLSKEIDLKSHTQQIYEDLLTRFEELIPVFEEHVTDYDELLPYVFMGDVTRYILSGGSQRLAIISYLNEKLKGGDEDIQNLISVGFVENLEDGEELERALQGVDADALREEWMRQRR